MNSCAIPHAVDERARQHLLRADGQEDLAFGIWYSSNGHTRSTALLQQLVLPREGDHQVHGNASFNEQFFTRALEEAQQAGGGLAFMHSHPFPGWQGLSRDDYRAEAGHAAAAKAATGLPLLGLTIGSDGAWSARTWRRTKPKTYEPTWCDTVRVAGPRLKVTYHPEQVDEYGSPEELLRTMSFWGSGAQEHLGRLRIGVVGLGSVGSIVCEILARMGIRNIVLIDFDRLKRHNLDRTLGANQEDLGHYKVEVAERQTYLAATAPGFAVKTSTWSVVEPEGYRVALDCDALFSCVDRPWPRRVLNHIAYAHCIPVIDGGILARRRESGSFRNAFWSLRTSGPGRACLECTGAYAPEYVSVDREGYLDDPSYIERLPTDSPLRSPENVMPLSMSIAGFECLQLVALAAGLTAGGDLGIQRYSYFPGIVDANAASCDAGCPHAALVGLGDRAEAIVGQVTGRHVAAERERADESGR